MDKESEKRSKRLYNYQTAISELRMAVIRMAATRTTPCAHRSQIGF